MFKCLVATGLVLASSVSVLAAPYYENHKNRNQRIQNMLEYFDAKTSTFMEMAPWRVDKNGNRVPGDHTRFTKPAVRSHQFVDEKVGLRRRHFRRRPVSSSGPEGILSESQENDQAADLVDELKFTDPVSMEKSGLLAAKLTETPWSSDYWPIYSGMIAKRYESENASLDWKENFENFVATTNSTSLDMLSPSEKYDLIVGDEKKILTAAMWAEGRSYYDSQGKVERWMGLCHGWAPAAYMVPRPAKTVTVLAADGTTKLKLFPSDIKALAILLWAKGHAPTRFIGGRCNVKDPAKNSNGRVIEQDCYDTNPGTWHLSVVNQIGVAKRSFVMDATYDYQVWNQPISGYKYSYFNPKTREPVKTLREATIKLKNFTADKFKDFRSANATQVVGVAMDVTYIVETQPIHNTLDTPEDDNFMTVTYLYDLELDDDGKIIGGEWYENRHPDFLWTPPQGARAVAASDRAIPSDENWSGEQAVPNSWRDAAKQSSRHGQPLAHVVEALVILSKMAE